MPIPATLPRIALVEDDDALRDDILMPWLLAHGFHCDGLGSAAALRSAMQKAPHDIVILDVGLPDANGFELARELHRTMRVGIVMLTSRDATTDRVRGLNDGADAYLAKPVDLDELVATLHSVLRRIRPEPMLENVWQLTVGGWCLVAPNGRRIALNVAERKVLGLLMEVPGTVVPRADMAAALSEDIYDFDPHRLEMMVHRLRSKIADATGEALPLRTVRGTGYVMMT